MNPIRSLQHMLNELARSNSNLPRILENGVFDETTLEAVMIFQRDMGYPVTGVVDQALWYAIVASYYDHLSQHGNPDWLSVFPDDFHKVCPNETTPEISIVQSMFNELANVVKNFQKTDVNGTNSAATQANLKELQRLAAVSMHGNLDRFTWSLLSHLYRMLITRQALARLVTK